MADRRTGTDEIKTRWRELYPADGNGRGKGIICPLCGSGSGKNGTGITEKPHSRNHFLKCWNGGCSFTEGGSVIDLYMMEQGMNPQTDFSKAVDELAARLNIVIDPYTGTRSTAAEDFAEEEAPAGNPSFSGTASSPAEEPADKAAQQPADFGAYYQQCRQNLLESAEAQACLKLRRAIRQDNPTPISAEDAARDLEEEWADVALCATVLRYQYQPNPERVDRNMMYKAKRWADRLQGIKPPAEGGGDP